MTHQQLMDLARDNTEVIDRVLDALRGTQPQTGEYVLLWIAGLSMGRRQVPIAKHGDSIAMEIFARAWQYGAAVPEDD